MKKIAICSVLGLLCGGAVLFISGCDWGSGGETGFNTSQGAGISVNFSGVYYGNLDGGGAVSETTGGHITRFVIHHSGNSIEVTDNNGSTYSGSIGSPGAVSSASGGQYPSGAEMVQSQISFSGHDNVAAKWIDFSGVIHVVAVDDVKGETKTTTETDTSSSSNYLNESVGTTVITTNGTPYASNTTVTITEDTIVPPGASPGDPGYERTVKTTTIVYGSSGEEISRSTSTQSYGGGSGDSEGSTDTTTVKSETTYKITEANSQYRLQGTWIEDGGVVANVDALSAGSAGVITSSSTSSSSGSDTNNAAQ